MHPNLHKLIISLFLAHLLVFQAFIHVHADVTVLPEKITAVDMSNTDVNRVVCTNGVINDAFFSQEKGVTVTNKGDSSFVKFLIKRDGVNPDVYASNRSEFYIVCDGVVYTLMATPRKIQAQTIWLQPGATERIAQNLAKYGPQVEEDRAITLTLDVMNDDIPDSYTVSEIPYEQMQWYANVIPDSKISKRRNVRVDGIGFNLVEYWVIPSNDMTFDEGMFLNEWFGNDIFAITLDTLNGNPRAFTRAFIVSRASS